MTWISPTSVYDYCDQETGYEATKSIDNNTATYWKHNYSLHTHLIKYDFGSSKLFTKIRLYQSGIYWGGPNGISVYVSDDPGNWGDAVWTGTLNASGWQESGSFSKTGRYIRLVSAYSASSEGIYEFEARTTSTYYATIAGNARIVNRVPKTVEGNARIETTPLETVAGNARVKMSSLEAEIDGDARIGSIESRMIEGTAQIYIAGMAAITGKARVQAAWQKELDGEAFVVLRSGEEIDGDGRLMVASIKTITGAAAVKAPVTETISGAAMISFTHHSTIGASAHIKLYGITKTVQGNARVVVPPEDPQYILRTWFDPSFDACKVDEDALTKRDGSNASFEANYEMSENDLRMLFLDLGIDVIFVVKKIRTESIVRGRLTVGYRHFLGLQPTLIDKWGEGGSVSVSANELIARALEEARRIVKENIDYKSATITYAGEQPAINRIGSTLLYGDTCTIRWDQFTA